MPLTNQQIKLIHVAAKPLGMNDQTYRMMLHNVAGVVSSKHLDQSGFEDCMAVLEESGYGQSFYWREIVQNRSTTASPRMVHKINELYDRYCQLHPRRDGQYQLAGLVDGASRGRVRDSSRLLPAEAWRLIEQLKAIIERLAPGTVEPVTPDLPF